MAKPVTTLLPALRPRVRYDGVPLRYEETKPAIVQVGAHKKILRIGEELLEREIQDLTRRQEKAVYTAQEDVWEQAEVIKVEAVEKALHVAQAEHERTKKRIARAHERNLRHELARVESEASTKFKEQLVVEKADSDARKAIEMREMEQQWQTGLAEALESTRLLEQEKCEAKLEECRRQEGVRTAEQLAELDIQHEKALLDQRTDYEEHIRDEIAATRQDAAAKTEARVDCTRDLYEQQLQVLRTYIGEKNDTIRTLQATVNGLVLDGSRLRCDLDHTRSEYSVFVNSAIPVEDAAGFLLPSFHSKQELKS